MPGPVSLLPVLLALMGSAFAGLSLWPSLHVALSNASVFVDFSTKSNVSAVRNRTLFLVDMATNRTVHARPLSVSQSAGRVELDCSCFLFAGTFRFLLGQTSVAEATPANGTDSKESTAWWWSSELQVQWPTFHIAVERAGNQSASFQVVISTNKYFQACSSGLDSALFLEVSFMEYNQIGRNSIDKVRARKRHPIAPLQSQTLELPCAFPFTERDFIRVALTSPHSAQAVKASGPLYLSRIFSYKLQVDNANAYRSGCEGTMTVKLLPPPCAHISGKVLLYKDGGGGRGGAAPAGTEPSSPPLAFNWLTQENETEFNCSVFDPGSNKYCFRFVFNFSRSPSPAQTCLVVHRSTETWGPWQQWSVCSASCGEGVRERVRECLLPSGGGGMQCSGMVKEQSLCSLEACAALPVPSPSLPPASVGPAALGGNMVVVVGISLCLAVILATVVVTIWRKLCQAPQCGSVRAVPIPSPGGRKLSDEASICGHSLQRPSLSEGPHHGGTAQKERPHAGSPPPSQTLVLPLPQDPERLSPTCQKVLPPIFGYRLAQQQLKEMKKKGLTEATQVYHVSSSPVHDTMMDASPSPVPASAHSVSPSSLRDDAGGSPFRIAAPFPEPSRVTPDRLSPRSDLVLGPALPGSGGSSKWRDRTAHWVEMVERSGSGGRRGRGGGDGGTGSHNQRNPHFRRTASFNDPKSPAPSSARSRAFRERSMTQVGSRTLPEGSSWSRGGWERQPISSYTIPEHGPPEWTRPAAHAELKHTGTNTSSVSAGDPQGGVGGPASGPRTAAPGPRPGSGPGPGPGSEEGLSGIGGPPTGPRAYPGAAQLSVERAELNWNRRGPSPIQRNILARKLKEAQSCSVRGRQRSSTFSAPTPEHRKDRCHSLPMSEEYSSSGGSPYRLSEAEQRMLDLDLSPSCGSGQE